MVNEAIANEAKIKEYIEKKEEKQQQEPNYLDSVTDLVWLEEETRDWVLSEWLKNDKSLLAYARLFNKQGKLNIWDSLRFKILEVKLSVTCPYFADFKDFLKELQRGEDTSKLDKSDQNYTEVINTTSTEKTELSNESKETLTHTFCWISINDIKSEPFQRSGKTGVTRCSKTARSNWSNFNVKLPRGNAYDAGKNPWNGCLMTIPSDKQNERPESNRESISTEKFNSEWKGNYADIYTNSKSIKYWHRASAFKDDSWEWYVLDPYTRVNWKLDNSPKKLKDYLGVKKIVKSHFYESKWFKWLESS